MKKKNLLLTAIVAMMLISVSVATAYQPIKILINNIEIYSDTPPMVVNNRTMVPLRAIAENLNCDVTWNGVTQQVDITPNGLAPTPESIEIIGPANFQQIMNESLNKMDANTRSFCQRYLSKIVYDAPPMDSRIAYIFPGESICYINGSRFNDMLINPSATHNGLVLLYAGIITHEANHSCIFISHQREMLTHAQEEALCDLAALRAVENAGGSRSSLEYQAFKKQFDTNLNY